MRQRPAFRAAGFQSTPPRGRRRCNSHTKEDPHIFQSTPPRGRRRKFNGRCAYCGSISIHASTREATVDPVRCDNLVRISIHASTREATENFTSTTPKNKKFQSTPPRGRRRRIPLPAQDFQLISIHASTREATFLSPTFSAPQKFQSTPPRGRRPARTLHRSRKTEFQSTPPRGRRLLYLPLSHILKLISIHASTREATRRGR